MVEVTECIENSDQYNITNSNGRKPSQATLHGEPNDGIGGESYSLIV